MAPAAVPDSVCQGDNKLLRGMRERLGRKVMRGFHHIFLSSYFLYKLTPINRMTGWRIG